MNAFFRTFLLMAPVAVAAMLAAGPVLAQMGGPALVRVAEASVKEIAPVTLVPGTVVSRNDARLAAERVVVTSGGCSYPGCGTTGDGYAWLAALGHTVVPPRPALVPLVASAGRRRSTPRARRRASGCCVRRSIRASSSATRARPSPTSRCISTSSLRLRE